MTYRFINADEASIFILSKAATCSNLFVYCNNTPTKDEDSSGNAVGNYIHAIGIQIAANIGGIPIGIEFLWSTKTWKLVVFMFAGISASANIALTVALLTLISFLSVKKMLKGTAANVLSPYEPKAMKKV